MILGVTGQVVGLNAGEEAMNAVGTQDEDVGSEQQPRSLSSLSTDSRSLGMNSLSTIERIDLGLDATSSMSDGSSRWNGTLKEVPVPSSNMETRRLTIEATSSTLRDTKLQMTPVQLRVADMLNRGLDARRTRKYLTWFPDVPNAHAAIVVR